jgi:hypothetical protein
VGMTMERMCRDRRTGVARLAGIEPTTLGFGGHQCGRENRLSSP